MNTQKNNQEQTNIAMRVIADHIRTIAFSIADGQLPSNAKAGYVIRRILRRAVRYGYTFLGQKSAFMYRLVPALVENMGNAYPELKAQQTLIEKVIKEEEEAFLRTLEKGIKLLDEAIPQTNGVLDGKVAFELYDTYGFPLDLTELIAKEKGVAVDIAGFNAEMEKQKARARNAAAVETGDWVVLREGNSEFVGYDLTEISTKILRYRKMSQKGKEFYQVVLEKTPFYAEKGGQVGDSGKLINNEKLKINIIDTKTENNLSVHILEQLPENLDGEFLAVVDVERRRKIEANHSATHLLHETLRELLGTHVEQKGSYVSPESLRFDFAHFQKVTPDEIRKLEHLVNKKIRENIALDEHRDTPIDEAKNMGAMALFGEKYGNLVRVVKYGSSVELCGGTHVAAIGNIGFFKILSESSIAAGIRRIEAVTGEAVENMLDAMQDFMATAREFLHNSPDLADAMRKMVEENAELKKKVEVFVYEKVADFAKKLLERAVENNDGVKIVKFKGDFSAEQAKNLAFQLRKLQPENLFAVIGSVFDGKPSLTILLSDDLVEKGMNAVQIIRDAAKEIQGGGGGQPFFAQAGGKNADGVEKAVEKASQI